MFQLKSWVHYMYFYITCIIVVHHTTNTLKQIKPCTITINPKFYRKNQIITLTYDCFSNVKEKINKIQQSKICRNLSFGFETKARAYKGAGQRWSPGVTFHATESVGECEGMNPCTPKWIPIDAPPSSLLNSKESNYVKERK